MSQEVAITATVKPAPGKLERFKELLDTAIDRLEKEEPETLQFEYYVSLEEGDSTISIFERYVNKDAMEKHRASPEFKAFFTAIAEEQLLTAPPATFNGSLGKALRR